MWQREGLSAATFLGIVSWRQSRCQLPNDPEGSAKECALRLEALGRHKSLWSREQRDHIWAVRVPGSSTELGCRQEGKGGDWIKVLMVSSRWESPRGMQKVKGGGGRKKGTEHKECKFLVGKNG